MRSKICPVSGASRLAPAPAAVEVPTEGPAVAGAVTGTCWFFDPMTCQPVDGTIVDGSLTVTGFLASDGVLHVTGTLTGTCTADDATGPAFTQEISTPVRVAVTSGPQTCRTLRLATGPIDVDRRELVVHTGAVVVSVSAQSGPGHLAGNLLETVGNSLSSDPSATHLAELLNHFLTVSR
jgi:hypothetical protein